MSRHPFHVRQSAFAAAIALITAAGASAAVITSEDFEDNDFQGWLANGNEFTFPGGNPGNYIGVPLLDFFGMQLRNETNPAVLGDLTRYGGPLTFSVDARTFHLSDLAGNPIDPQFFNLTLELVDYGDPGNGAPYVSVYTTLIGLPRVEDGWVRYEYTIPMQESLPSGWGGTGAEDDDFMPVLPPNVTYGDVLRNVDEFRVTTFEPGFFYGFNLWEFGWDNVKLEVIPAPGATALLGMAGLAALRRRRA